MINVLYQFNEKYAPYAGTSIVSLFEHSMDTEVHVFILGEELSLDSLDRFQALAQKYGQKIEVINAVPVIERVKAWGIPAYRGANSANLRLFIPFFLKEDVNRVLYLDADTIVNGSIISLYNMDMQDKVAAMALDSLGRIYKRVTLGFSETDLYFNSGVVLFNLLLWREKRCSERIITHVKSREWTYTSPDQDLLNVVCKGDILKLDAKYNFQPIHDVFRDRTYFACYGREGYYTEEELAESRAAVCIFHSLRFIGEFPWDASSIHPYTSLFDHYLAKTPWNDYLKRYAKKTHAMKIEKVLYRFLPRSIYLRLFVFFHNRYLQSRPEANNK